VGGRYLTNAVTQGRVGDIRPRVRREGKQLKGKDHCPSKYFKTFDQKRGKLDLKAVGVFENRGRKRAARGKRADKKKSLRVTLMYCGARERKEKTHQKKRGTKPRQRKQTDLQETTNAKIEKNKGGKKEEKMDQGCP